jgi:ribonuclease HII
MLLIPVNTFFWIPSVRALASSCHRQITVKTLPTMTLRRSARLQSTSKSGDLLDESNKPPVSKRKNPTSTKTRKQKSAHPPAIVSDSKSDISNDTDSSNGAIKVSSKQAATIIQCLPRLREQSLLSNQTPQLYTHVIGIDEAGRGPLAGPVVAAAAYLPNDISGIVDSKKITKEEEREILYEQIVASENVCWAVAVVNAQRIDEINILQATLEAMTMAATALVADQPENMVEHASTEHTGCYVVRRLGSTSQCIAATTKSLSLSSTFALVDGNRLPVALPVPAEAIVKGDSKEYSIAAASILAKVTRDRLMNAYAVQYPDYNFQQHKGYPTKAHMAAIYKHGAVGIHRRTFAPLKHMDL